MQWVLRGVCVPVWRADRRGRLIGLLLAAGGFSYLLSNIVQAVRETLADPPVHTDFHSLWSYARIAMQDGAQSVYDQAHLWRGELALGRDPTRPSPLPFAFPPHFLLLIWPLGWFGYAPAYLLWMAATLALLLWVAPRARLLILLAPATAATIAFGQSGFLIAAMLVGGMRLVPRWPLLGGALLGLATCKPQLGLLVPVALLAMGAWRAVAAAIVATLLLVSLSALVFGSAIWPTWLAVLPHYSARFDAEMTDYWYLMPTVEGNLRLVGLGAGVAKLAQATVALPVVVLTWRVFRRGASEMALATLCVGTFLVTPHAFVYDLSLAVVGIGCFVHARLAAGGLTGLEVASVLAVLLLPVAMMTYLSPLPLAAPSFAVLLAVMVCGERRASPLLSALPSTPNTSARVMTP